MKKLSVSAVALVATLFLNFSPVFAQYGQYGQYGAGGPTPSLIIDKMVGKVTSDKGSTTLEFVDNLAPSDPRFKPEDTVTFRLKVKNTSSKVLTDVTVTDTLPSFVTFADGPGSLNNNVLTIKAGDFKVNEEKTYDIKAKLTSQAHMPSDKSILCLVNVAKAQVSGATDEDTAQFCVEKQVAGVTTPSGAPTPVSQVPAAGAPNLVLLGFYTLSLAAGLRLKRRAI